MLLSKNRGVVGQVGKKPGLEGYGAFVAPKRIDRPSFTLPCLAHPAYARSYSLLPISPSEPSDQSGLTSHLSPSRDLCPHGSPSPARHLAPDPYPV